MSFCVCHYIVSSDSSAAVSFLQGNQAAALDIVVTEDRQLPTVALFLGRVAVCTMKVTYGCQTFPVTICRSVGLSIQCIVEKWRIGSGCYLGW